jgi:Relaxase/Mobilisation nuclease domain
MVDRANYRPGFESVVRYAFSEKKDPVIVASAMCGTTPREITAEFLAVAARNTRCKNPCGHFILSPARDEVLSREQWQEICEKVAKEFGAVQWVAVLHQDTSCRHVSLVLNRINLDGKAWTTSNDRYRLRAICRDFEQQHGLTRTPERSHAVRVDKDEIEKAQRLHREGKCPDPIPERLRIAVAVRAALRQCPTLAEFQDRLVREKITTRWRYDGTGKAVGVSFGRGEASVSGRNAGVSCRTLSLHYGENGTISHEHSRRIEIAGGTTAVAPAFGGPDRIPSEGGTAGEYQGVGGGTEPAERLDRGSDCISRAAPAHAIRTVGDLLCRALAGMGAMAMAEARDSERFIQAQQARQKRARPLPPVSRRRFLTRKPSISR